MANALSTFLRRRDSMRDFKRTIAICGIAALLLIPAIIWFNLRFTVRQASLSSLEVVGVLCYVVICGWVLPLGATAGYMLMAQPRAETESSNKARQKHVSQPLAFNPPRYQPGMLSPFVFSEVTPWGWLEYSNGNFQGQRLALKRQIATIGRDESCDIWLDDDLASRFHAELAWEQGQIFLTDCESLNGVLLNGRPVHGTNLLTSSDTVQVGSHRFIFTLAGQAETAADQYDPLVHHTWRSSLDLQSNIMPTAKPALPHPILMAAPVRLEPITPPWEPPIGVTAGSLVAPKFERVGMLLVCDGQMAGRTFMVKGPVMTVGSGAECDIMLQDNAIARQHIQFIHQAQGDFIQGLADSYGVLINGRPLANAYLLQSGDVIMLGQIRLRYTLEPATYTTPLPGIPSTPRIAVPMSGPMRLKLPSRQKDQ